MSSQGALWTLPTEIFNNIAVYLTAHELAILSYVCKHLYSLATPFIWTDIELHEAGYHESRSELNQPPPHRLAAERPYHRKQPWGSGQGACNKAESLFTMLQTLHKEDIEKLKILTQRVKHLCTAMSPMWRPRDKDHPWDIIDPDEIQVWQLLPLFSNLETLEVHADDPGSEEYEEPVAEITSPAPRLSFLKLSGYIPRTVSAWALLSGVTLERLELGMLDRPISTCLSNKPKFKPLPEENLAGPDDDDSDYGSLYEDCVIPRPLGRALPSPKTLALPKLKHLFLCQPAPSSTYDSVREYGWSTRAENACLKDWKSILLESENTVEVLVLEQRLAADYIEGDGCSELDWMEWHTDPDASDSLLSLVEEILTSYSGFRRLKHLYLYGIGVYEEDGAPTTSTPAGRLMSLMKDRGIKAEARLGKWCYFDHSTGSVSWATWCGSDGEDDEDEEEEEEEEDEEEEEEDEEDEAEADNDRGENEDEKGEKRKWDTLLVSV